MARSVASLKELALWSQRLVAKGGKLVTIKGGDISGELSICKKQRFVSKIEVFDSGERKSVIVEFVKKQNNIG